MIITFDTINHPASLCAMIHSKTHITFYFLEQWIGLDDFDVDNTVYGPLKISDKYQVINVSLHNIRYQNNQALHGSFHLSDIELVTCLAYTYYKLGFRCVIK